MNQGDQRLIAGLYNQTPAISSQRIQQSGSNPTSNNILIPVQLLSSNTKRAADEVKVAKKREKNRRRRIRLRERAANQATKLNLAPQASLPSPTESAVEPIVTGEKRTHSQTFTSELTPAKRLRSETQDHVASTTDILQEVSQKESLDMELDGQESKHEETFSKESGNSSTDVISPSVEENEKDNQEMTEEEQQDDSDLKVVITTVPVRKLGYSLLEQVQKSLTEKIFDSIVSPSSSYGSSFTPAFRGKPMFINGALRMWCENEQTLAWLKMTVANLPISHPHYKLTVVKQKDLISYITGSILLPRAEDMDIGLIHLLLIKQNPWYNVISWMVFSAQRQAKGLYITVGIPRTELPKIVDRERRVAYLAGSVYLMYLTPSELSKRKQNGQNTRHNKSPTHHASYSGRHLVNDFRSNSHQPQWEVSLDTIKKIRAEREKEISRQDLQNQEPFFFSATYSKANDFSPYSRRKQRESWRKHLYRTNTTSTRKSSPENRVLQRERSSRYLRMINTSTSPMKKTYSRNVCDKSYESYYDEDDISWIYNDNWEDLNTSHHQSYH